MDLSEIKAALAAATPGPWRLCPGGIRLAGTWHPIIDRGSGSADIAWMAHVRDDCAADAHLIANAPAWLAALCAEVERLTGWQRRACDELIQLENMALSKGRMAVAVRAVGLLGEAGYEYGREV